MYAGKIVEEGSSAALFSPLHPYTKALINAIPSKEKRGKNLENIHGKVPTIEDRQNGCPFAPRCSKAQDICKETFPPAKETDSGTSSAASREASRGTSSAASRGRVYCYFPENENE